jgi:multidrug efflux pump subunit AcrA (membrane-fusion protein)
MNHATFTDDTELAQQMTKRAQAALALAEMIDGDEIDRAAALITAAAVLIERGSERAGTGRAGAADALAALIGPQLTEWRGATH